MTNTNVRFEPTVRTRTFGDALRVEGRERARPAAAQRGLGDPGGLVCPRRTLDVTPRRLGLDSRVYVLEAFAGSGIAVGWRHIIERSLGAGTPVVLGGELDGACYGVLTGNGRRGGRSRAGASPSFDLDRNRNQRRCSCRC